MNSLPNQRVKLTEAIVKEFYHSAGARALPQLTRTLATKRDGREMPNPESFSAHFKDHLDSFRLRNPFRRAEQLSNHRNTILLRLQLGSARAAIDSDEFTKQLHSTLRSWGIGMRRSRLAPLGSFREALRARATAIEQLDHVPIEEAKSHGELIWQVINSLGIVSNDAPVVSGTKALHHILPELVVPIDRGYTQVLFGWQNPQFQYHQEQCFLKAHNFFVEVSRLTEPRQYVGEGWFTSATKIIDNAVVGAIREIEAMNGLGHR